MPTDFDVNLDTSIIRQWRSIVTLIVFVLTNLAVLFPFDIPIYVPRWLSDGFLDSLSALRLISPRQKCDAFEDDNDPSGKVKSFVRLDFPVNFMTAPLIADLFLLAVTAIGGAEVAAGTIGSNGIVPLDIMGFFITLAYIAISIDASGVIRYLAFKVLQWGGNVGHKLFLYLYTFFFLLGSFIGNDPIILSGTAFLAYMTRVSSNIVHPKAWIHTQFAVANIASAILVSSNPTNLVLASAFSIHFITYTLNMIVPVVVTAILLFPFLLYIVFANPDLIPLKITMHELSEEAKARKPINPNIPHGRGIAEEDEILEDGRGKTLSLEEVMNPFLDKGSAAFGGIVMAATLVTLLAINATGKEKPVIFVTAPGAFVMLCWDLIIGWIKRHETRDTARKGRREIELARAERQAREEEAARELQEGPPETQTHSPESQDGSEGKTAPSVNGDDEKIRPVADIGTSFGREVQESELEKQVPLEAAQWQQPPRKDLVSITKQIYSWFHETFPTVTAVFTHLPFALVPFALCMFILVQGLVTTGWVQVFAYGWDHWVGKTGTIGAIGGMGFLSVVLCNFAGTNIGTTILLSRVIQAWVHIHNTDTSLPFISDRIFWATVYAMALGVNYGAFSAAFSASLAGLLWRDILGRKHIRVRRLEFARVNLPIITIAMTIGCLVLVGEVYIMRSPNTQFSLS